MEECLQRLNKLLMKYWWKPSFLSHLCHIQTNQYIRRELSGEFVSSPIMLFTSSHVSIPCRTTLFRLHCYQLSSSKFSASNMRLYLKFMYFWVADWVEWLKMFVWGLYAKIGLETMYILLLLDIFFMRGRFELINLENKRVLIPTNNVGLFLCTSNTSTSNAICNFFLLLPCKCNSHEN